MRSPLPGQTDFTAFFWVCLPSGSLQSPVGINRTNNAFPVKYFGSRDFEQRYGGD